MTAEQMQKEIYDCCINIILKSNILDWCKEFSFIYYTKDNITIYILDTPERFKFNVKIYKKEQRDLKKEFEIYDNEKFWVWEIRKRQFRKQIENKYNEIFNYFTNKSKYDSVLEIYNLLPEIPIRELRKKKLQNIGSKYKFFK